MKKHVFIILFLLSFSANFSANADEICDNKNDAEGFKILSDLAEKGDVSAQRYLGMAYDNAWCGQQRDFDKMVYWYDLAAKNDDYYSQERIQELFSGERNLINKKSSYLSWKIFDSDEFGQFIAFTAMGGFIFVIPIFFGLVYLLCLTVQKVYLRCTRKGDSK